ncbi:MAG TPA: carbohydrate binding family 9 domain-containing protein, partial [Thermoanaerobaculia bacterium]|nr:carbohydrate binding family 9 domain-containing protein [Thermoanaerobaculia bacterium]
MKTFAGAVALLVPAFVLAAPPEPAATSLPPITVHRLSGSISIDGDLSDPGWVDAAVVDQFWETQPGDNTPPKVKTRALLAYDAKYLYIGIDAQDPEPRLVRAPYVDRDQVLGTDDNIAIFLDTRNDRKSAVELRVNPRGSQGDASWNEATGTEDFSPDLFYDTAARVTATGWTAEYRIPFSSLRYPRGDPQTWGILIWRNYPRDFRYAIHSSPIPRGSNCLICHMRTLTGLSGLPEGGHLVAAPY